MSSRRHTPGAGSSAPSVARRPRRPLVRLGAGALAAAVLLGAAGRARAGLRIVEQSAAVDRDAGRAAFAVRFDSAPDLFTVDEFGRLADSFQYEVDADGPVSAEFPVGDVEAVVRGDEIRLAGALRVRAAGAGVEPDDDPAAGGWGPVRAAVPFNLDGPDLSFEVPLAALGDDDGRFSYRLFTAEFGLTVDQVQGVVGASVPIPLPPAAPSAAAACAALALIATLRRAGKNWPQRHRGTEAARRFGHRTATSAF